MHKGSGKKNPPLMAKLLREGGGHVKAGPLRKKELSFKNYLFILFPIENRYFTLRSS